MAGLGSFLHGAASGIGAAKQMDSMQKQNDMLKKVGESQPGTQQPQAQATQQPAQQPAQGAGLSPQQPAQPQADNSWAFIKSLFGGNG